MRVLSEKCCIQADMLKYRGVSVIAPWNTSLTLEKQQQKTVPLQRQDIYFTDMSNKV